MRTTRLAMAARPVLLAAFAALASVPLAAPLAAQAPSSAAPIAATAPNGVGSAFELTFWQSVATSEDSASYEAYLARYPDGTFSGLARARIAALQRAAAAQPAATPAPAPTAASAPAPAPAPAVLLRQQASPQVAPKPAVALLAPAPAPAEAAMIPAVATASTGTAPATSAAPTTNATFATAEAGPSPLARLLTQLRGSGSANAQEPTPAASVAAPTSAPLVTVAPPVQQLPPTAPGLAAVPAPAPAQPVYAPTAAPAAAPTLTPAATPAVSYASARPLLLPVPDVLLPAYFCSTDARNEFHNNAYRPAVEVATRNNEAAVGYLRQLQQTYDRGQLGRDTAVLNAIAAEARAYQGEAARAYSAQAALVRQFDALMAVPLRTCATPAR